MPTATKAATEKPVAKKKSPEQPLMKALRAEHRHIATVMQLFSDQ
ncbi:MAG: cation-binding protein, partial [Halieaceae bacterium]|nr:cation-binding protein [Halieaceae bacterium]